jgi:ribonucleoside-triphosphate reductase (formate)
MKTKCEIYSRVVGFIRPLENWHEGKQQEFRDRKLFGGVNDGEQSRI